jgi:4-hydroxy 2-oxovalerate aldolase
MTRQTSIDILDVTLRDGGHVNDFNFGWRQIRTIVESLCRAKIDVIELGFLKNVEYHKDKTLFSIVAQAEALLEGLSSDQEYSLMIRPDWYDINQLGPCTGKIRKLRWAFHARDLELSVAQAQKARSLGFEIYFNPVNVFSYSDAALRDVLQAANELEPASVAIVDTHGSMVERDLLRYYEVFDEVLKSSIGLSVHLHENLSLSFSLAQKFISISEGKRAASIDASVLGMGRIPGNLCTELIARYLNIYYGRDYVISAVYDAIQDPISGIKLKFPWGYEPIYAETAFRRTHRSYAEYIIENTGLTLSEASAILAQIEDAKDREEFDRLRVDELVARYRLT